MFGLEEGDEIIIHCLDYGKKDIMAMNPIKLFPSNSTTYLHSSSLPKFWGEWEGSGNILCLFRLIIKFRCCPTNASTPFLHAAQLLQTSSLHYYSSSAPWMF